MNQNQESVKKLVLSRVNDIKTKFMIGVSFNGNNYILDNGKDVEIPLENDTGCLHLSFPMSPQDYPEYNFEPLLDYKFRVIGNNPKIVVCVVTTNTKNDICQVRLNPINNSDIEKC